MPLRLISIVVGDVAARGAGVAEDEGEVALVDALEADFEVLQRTVGGVLLAEIGRLAVGGIDAEDGEVARVARPHPVVGVAAELADVRGRGSDKAHVGEDLVDIHKVLVAIVEGFYHGLVVSTLGGAGGDGLDVLGDNGLAVLLGGLVVDAGQDLLGDVLHADEAGDAEAGAGQLLVAAHGPEAVGQVVVLDGGVADNLAVAAVVVGEQKAFVADELAGAAAAEEDDGILERGLVDVVDVLRADAHAGTLHGGFVALEEHGDPHAFVGAEGQHGECHDEGCKEFLH